MFNMIEIGKKIADKRKQKNLTQMELADYLGISFQAVSNWERGDTMPDISKLPELSQILEISIDSLLGNSKDSQVVEKIILENDNYGEKIPIDDVINISPILKPDQINKLVNNDEELSEEQLLALAPFIDTDTLDEFARMIENNQGISKLIALAPFLSTECLDEIAFKVSEREETKDLISLAPFLSSEVLEKLALKNDNIENLLPLAPFLSSETISKYTLQNYHNNGIECIVKLAPFLSQEVLNEIVNEEIKTGNLMSLKPLFPFLDSEFIKNYFQSKINKK